MEIDRYRESVLALALAVGAAWAVSILFQLSLLLQLPRESYAAVLALLMILSWIGLMLLERSFARDGFVNTLLLSSFFALLGSVVVHLSLQISFLIPFALLQPTFYYLLLGWLQKDRFLSLLLLSLFFIPFLLPILG